MRKTGKIKLFLTILLVLVALAAVGCGSGDDHTHTFSEFWAYDSAQHWQPSTCNHNARRSLAAHEFSEIITEPSESSAGYTTYSCSCGYSYIDNRVDPLPNENSGLRYDENGHWKSIASEGEQPDVKPHGFTDEVVAPTCAAYGYTKHTCGECGYWVVDTPVNPVGHEVDDNVWAHDGEIHWKPCLNCDVKLEPATHTFAENTVAETCYTDGYTDYTCGECGYSYRGAIVEKHHTYSSELLFDDYDHWFKPNCGHDDAPKYEAEEHIFIGKSNVCELCKKQVADRLKFKLSDDGSYYSVENIGSIKVAEVAIPATYRNIPVKKILPRAFKGESLTSITIPEGVTSIGEYAFENCASLTSVTAGSVTEIGDLAFSDCSSLTTFDISNCTSIGFAAFDGCSQFAPAIPEHLEDLGEYAFGGTKITSATLPASLKSVPGFAFDGCTSLTSVTVNSPRIGKNAFNGCTSLTSVTLNGTQRISDYAFGGCTSLSALTLPESIIEVGANAFDGTSLVNTDGNLKIAAGVVVGTVDKNVTSVTVPNGVIGIANDALRDCTKLNAITLGGVRFIGNSALRNTTALTAVEFTTSVKFIGANAFRESGLTSVTVPATVDSVGDNAFYDCKSLISANINAKVIGKFAFSYTGVDRELESPIKKRPSYATLASVTLGDNVTEIGSNAFQYCPITKVTLPANLEKIGKYAFAQTDITSITVPASVNYIGEYAFYGTKLKTATLSVKQGWKAGKNVISEDATASKIASLLTKAASNGGYVDYDWVRA